MPGFFGLKGQLKKGTSTFFITPNLEGGGEGREDN